MNRLKNGTFAAGAPGSAARAAAEVDDELKGDELKFETLCSFVAHRSGMHIAVARAVLRAFKDIYDEGGSTMMVAFSNMEPPV